MAVTTNPRSPLDPVVVVLVGTTHPGNIGASARAMKTMGLRRLRLVEPKRFPSAEATERAAGADDLLHEAEIYPSLAEALADTAWAIGTSARPRHLDWPMLSPRAAAAEVLQQSPSGPVALVFGRERSGLSNDELDRCQALVQIPTDPGFRSLNLASSVQILAYELYQGVRERATAAASAAPQPSRRLARPEELEGLFDHLERALSAIGYLDPERPRLLLRRLRRLFHRARLEHAELNIVRGILRAAEEAARAGGRPADE